MSLTVRQRAEALATFRFVQVNLMEMLARWVPTTPEMEVKLLFGQHIWDVAQHADALGRRTFELRAPLHYTLAPMPGYLEFLRCLAAATGTADRVHGAYDVLLPALGGRYRGYLAETDDLLDAPSVRIVESILLGLSRMQQEGRDMRAQLPDLAAGDPVWLADLASLESAEATLVSPSAAAR
jgi:hypothetical protein